MNDRGSVVALGVFLLIIVVGLSLVYYGHGAAQAEEQALENAVEIDVEIVETGIESRERIVQEEDGPDDGVGMDDDGRTVRETVYRPIVEFTYEYDGEQYRSSNIYPGGGTFQEYDDRSAAESDLAPYTEGTTATGYVDPERPGEGFLIAEQSGTPQGIMLVGGFFTLVGVLGAVLWLR